ncbi:MAG: hypothetical protein U5K51_05260 [Flavobacteriaceae bacterium]|nr:hypothetical protein [Flavobacteriaceae bacterium]
MKTLLAIFVMTFYLFIGQCSGSDDEPEVEVTLNELSQKEKEIDAFIAAGKCSPDGCGFIAFGSKPCGGPWKYIVYPKSIDIEKLTQMVNAYNEMQHQYNLQTNAVSDCMAVMPPEEVACVNGVCTIVK